MTPRAAIAALDRHLARHGQDIVLQRLATDSEGVVTVTAEQTCRAAVTAGTAPQSLDPMSGEAPNTKIIMSPTSLVGWVGLPAKDDRILIESVPNNIEIVTPRLINGQLVRIELETRS